MQIMHAFSDVLAEIEVIKEQLEITESEIEYWYLDGRGSEKYGANASVIQTNRLMQSKNKLLDRLDTLEKAKTRTEMLMKQFEGLEYRIAYLRIVEGMAHTEIADELGYTEGYIRNLWSKMKSKEKARERVQDVTYA